jgi:TolB-like protein/cytochrome c-type biogenesis protein CcmH/NrfG
MTGVPLVFGPFVFDDERQTLLKHGSIIHISQKGLLLLRTLLEADGAAVTKSALMKAAWPNALVEESNLTVQIAALRRCLGDAPGRGQWIVTVPRVGYRFVHSDRSVADGAAATAALAGKTAIAVMPFANLSSEPEQDFFTEGLTDDLITDLSKTPGLLVIARTSSFVFRARQVDAREVARKLGVRFLVEGSVRRTANRVRINAQLIDAASNSHIWGDRFDRDLADVFALQDEIVARIVEALSGALPGTRRVTHRRTASLEAYELFVRGKAQIAQASESTATGRDLLRGAIRLDPSFADAYAWLADGLRVAWIYGGEPEASLRPKARDAAQRAVSLDPENADARWSLGLVLAYDGLLADGIAEVEAALRLNPNHADAWAFLTDLMVLDGQPAKGIDCARHAMRLNPYPPAVYHWFLGLAQYAAGQYDEAVTTLRHEATHRQGSQRVLAASLAQLGRVDEARAEAGQFLSAYPEFTATRWGAVHPFRNDEDRGHFIEGYVKAGLPL